MFAKLLTVLAAGLGLASAYTTPTTQLTGNPVLSPGSTDIVPVGQPFTITWDGTGLGSTVTLVLLRGPSTNVVPIATIVEDTPNTGSYVWTPSTSLQDDVTGYGIQMIDDATGKFQYTTQFGVSNKAGPPASSSAAPAPPASSGWPSESGWPSASGWPAPSHSGKAWSSEPAHSKPTHPSKPVESEEPCTESEGSWPTAPPTKPSGSWPVSSAWAAAGNGSGSVWPSNIKTSVSPSSTYTPAQVSTNDAGRFTMSIGGAVIALGAAVMLL